MNMQKRFSIVMVIVLILSLTAGTVTSFAETNQQKLNRINQEISAAKNQLSAAQAEVSSLTAQVNALDSQISATSAQIAQTQAQISETRSNIQVKVQELEDGEAVDEFTLVICGDAEEDPANNKISYQAPIGKGLMGCEAGQVVDIEVPAGVLTLKVLEVARA